MKSSIIMLSLLFIIGLSFTSAENLNISNEPISTLYKVQKIEKKRSLYILHVKKNDSMFIVISKRDVKKSFDCKKIKVGQEYYLNLELIFSCAPTINGINFAPNLGLVYQYKKTTVPADKYGCEFYMAKNLKGLCIEENPQR